MEGELCREVSEGRGRGCDLCSQDLEGQAKPPKPGAKSPRIPLGSSLRLLIARESEVEAIWGADRWGICPRSTTLCQKATGPREVARCVWSGQRVWGAGKTAPDGSWDKLSQEF